MIDHGCSNEDGTTDFYRGCPVPRDAIMHIVEKNWNSGPDNIVEEVMRVIHSSLANRTHL